MGLGPRASAAGGFVAGAFFVWFFASGGSGTPPPAPPRQDGLLGLAPGAAQALDAVRAQVRELMGQNDRLLTALASLPAGMRPAAAAPAAAASAAQQLRVSEALSAAAAGPATAAPLRSSRRPRRSGRPPERRHSDPRFSLLIDNPSAWIFSRDDPTCDAVEDIWERLGSSPTLAKPRPTPSGRPKVLVLLYMCWGGSSGRCDPDSGDLASLVPPEMTDPDTLPPPERSCRHTGVSQSHTNPGGRRLLTNTQSRAPDFIRRSLLNKVGYARRHGFGVKLAAGPHPGPDRSPSHGTTLAVRAELPRWDWVYYVDLDTIITDMSKSILDVTGALNAPPERAVWITRNWHGINTGSILYRGGPAADRVLALVHELASPSASSMFPPSSFLLPGDVPPHTPPATNPWGNQLGLMKVLTCVRDIDPIVEYVPAKKMNAYPGTTWMPGQHRHLYEWRKGDFLIHFAGCGDIASRNCDDDFARHAALGDASCSR